MRIYPLSYEVGLAAVKSLHVSKRFFIENFSNFVKIEIDSYFIRLGKRVVKSIIL